MSFYCSLYPKHAHIVCGWRCFKCMCLFFCVYIYTELFLHKWNVFIQFYTFTYKSKVIRKALPGLFLCIFSSRTCLKKPVFSKRDLLGVGGEGTSQATLGVFWPAEGTSQPVTISKKRRNPSSALHRGMYMEIIRVHTWNLYIKKIHMIYRYYKNHIHAQHLVNGTRLT